MKAKLDLDAIEARANAATPGPWIAPEDHPDRMHIVYMAHDPKGGRCGNEVAEAYAVVDAAFIAHAREDVPALVARVRELEEALEEALRPDPVWEQLDALAPPSPRNKSTDPVSF